MMTKEEIQEIQNKMKRLQKEIDDYIEEVHSRGEEVKGGLVQYVENRYEEISELDCLIKFDEENHKYYEDRMNRLGY